MIQGIDIHKSFWYSGSTQRSRYRSKAGRSGGGGWSQWCRKDYFAADTCGTLDRPNRGSVFIDGTQVSALGNREQASFRNRHIGFVFQFHQLLPEFTALENVSIPALIAGKSKKEAEALAMEMLDHLNLSDRINHKPSELSGGENQRWQWPEPCKQEGAKSGFWGRAFG